MSADTIFSHPDWRGWFESMQSPAWDRTTALIFADQCREWGETAIEEYVRVSVEHDGRQCEPTDRHKQQRPCRRFRKRAGGNWCNCCEQQELLDIILRDNPSWSSLPCPACPPEGKRPATCTLCGGSGDLLRHHDTNAHIVRRGEQWPTNPRPLTRWSYTPFIRGVGLRMEEVAKEGLVPCHQCSSTGYYDVAGYRNQCPLCCGNAGGKERGFRPTPLALALHAGLPTLRQLRVTDREPMDGTEGGWFWSPESMSGERRTPPPIFQRMKGEKRQGPISDPRFLYYPTPDAARDALASGVWQWVAGFKPKEGK